MQLYLPTYQNIKNHELIQPFIKVWNVRGQKAWGQRDDRCKTALIKYRGEANICLTKHEFIYHFFENVVGWGICAGWGNEAGVFALQSLLLLECLSMKS